MLMAWLQYNPVTNKNVLLNNLNFKFSTQKLIKSIKLHHNFSNEKIE